METTQQALVIFEQAGQPVEVRLDTNRDTVWLTQRQMSELFDTSIDNIGLHLKNIFADDELQIVEQQQVGGTQPCLERHHVAAAHRAVRERHGSRPPVGFTSSPR